jgi:hypothetical protein
MSLWGKIFAVLNIVAATVFILVAGIDWGQRQRWAYSVYRHDLLVEGLPIDAKEQDPDGTPRVDKLSPATLNAILPSSTGTQVTTQQDEVKRVRSLVEGKINDNNVPGTTGQKLSHYLIPLARSAHQRDLLTAYSRDKNAVPNEEVTKQLQADFNHEFDGVNEVGSDGAKHSLQQRKENAARLLFLLGEALHEDQNADYFASPAYKRFVNVVGLNGAARAADDESLLAQEMTNEAVSAHAAELGRAVTDLDEAVYRAQGYADAVERQEHFLKIKENEVSKAKSLVQARTEQVNALKDQLAGLQGKTAKSLADQAKAEQEVMDRLIELRDTGKKNQELEREIRRLEGVK